MSYGNAVLTNADYLKLGGGLPFQPVPARPSTLFLTDPLYDGGNFGQYPVPGFQGGPGLGTKWTAGYGVGAVDGTELVLTQVELDEQDTYVRRLLDDINAAVSVADVNTKNGQAVLVLQANYLDFFGRWADYYARMSAMPASVVKFGGDRWASMVHEYNSWVDAFTALGGKTTAPKRVASVSTAATLEDKALAWLPWIGAGLLLYFTAPIFVPLLLARHAAH